LFPSAAIDRIMFKENMNIKIFFAANSGLQIKYVTKIYLENINKF